MTPAELIRTKTFQSMARPEQQEMLRKVKDGTLLLADAPSPGPEEYEQGLIGPTGLQPPQRTMSTAEEFFAPMKAGMEDPTWTEQLLPKNFATTALSGVERGARLGLGMVGTGLAGTGRVIAQALENAPRLIGEEPVSTPVSRVAEEVPGLIAQAKMPSTGTGITRETPRNIVNAVRGAPAAAARTTRSAAAMLRQDAAAMGIPLTRAESTLNPITRATESLVEVAPFGMRRIRDYKEKQRAATEAAARRTGEYIHPDLIGKEEAGSPIQQLSAQRVQQAKEAEAARKAARANQAGEAAADPAQTWVHSLGPDQSSEQFVAGLHERMEAAENAARAEASVRYRAVEQVMGRQPAIPMTHTAELSSEVSAEQARLHALRQPQVSRAAGALEDITVPPPPAGADPMAPLTGGPTANAAAELIAQYRLAEGRLLDYPTWRALDSQIGGMIRGAPDNVARQLRGLQRAMRQDMNEFAATLPGNPGQMLREANEFYRTRVAEHFDEDSAIRALRETNEARRFDKVLLDPQGAERIHAIRGELERVDPEAWQHVERRFGERLYRDAIDPVTGNFDPATFTRALHKYTPESLAAILGDRADGVNQLRARFQGAARGAQPVDNPIQAAAIFRKFAEQNPGIIVENLAKRPTSEVALVKGLLRPEQWNQMARSWWQEVMLPKAFSPDTKVFSRARFLTELNRTDPAKLRLLIGEEAADHVDTLARVMRQQEKVRKLGDNPPGTADKLIMGAQLSQLGLIGGALMVGRVREAVTATGATILTPMLLSRLLVKPKGAALLAEAAQAIPGTRAAHNVARRIAIMVANEKGQQDVPERNSPTPQ